ncbi:uncharacterized protein LOC118647156 [Monomorium pharaonis]|uniref:uncharacterized protein LOC118647156 n=1 Tax=Monomorium pharaonis TaxID=307658 RepID=UPI001746749B|nr:uncharacterized protein LOC118647156 [Monomorium pharaonis]
MRLMSLIFTIFVIICEVRFFYNILRKMDLVSFDIFINDDLTITIQTDQKSAERGRKSAFTDYAYLQEITNQELNKLNMKTANKMKDVSQSAESNKENIFLEHSQCKNEERSISLWAQKDTHLLITLYKEKEDDLKKGRIRQGQFWENIAKKINKINSKIKKTAIQCSNKMSCLKRTYKNIKDYNNKSGNDRKTWLFYEEMDEIFGTRASILHQKAWLLKLVQVNLRHHHHAVQPHHHQLV